jgi:hypothetical protein
MSTAAQNGDATFRTVALRALVVGGVGAAVCLLGVLLDAHQFFRSYLAAFMFWLGLSLGALAIWMLHNLTGGQWGIVIRRLLEAATRVLPLLALMFVPLAFGLPYVYPWALEGAEADPHLKHKIEVFLNLPFFLTRAAIYFAVWVGLALVLNYWSALQDRANDRRLARRVQSFSGPGLLLLGLTVTFAAIDWVMSLDPKWYSTIFGALIGTGMVLPALGLAIAAACWLAPRKPLADVVNPDVLNDLGNLLLAFVLLVTYMAFSQFLLVWSGNLPEEITWYLARSAGGWEVVAAALGLFYFAFPFFLLLSRDIKRHPERLGWVALAVAAVSIVHQFWLIKPSFHDPDKLHAPLSLHWLDVATVLAVGGLWVAEFFRQLQQRPLVPVHNPTPEEVLTHA